MNGSFAARDTPKDMTSEKIVRIHTSLFIYNFCIASNLIKNKEKNEIIEN